MDKNSKLFRIISFSLLGLSGLMSIYFFMTDFNDVDATATATGIFIMMCYVFFGLAVIITLAFSVIGMATDLKKAKSALIGVAALVVICGVAYVLSGNEIHSNMDGDILADASISQISEGGLIAFYILAVIAVGTIIFAEISKAFK